MVIEECDETYGMMLSRDLVGEQQELPLKAGMKSDAQQMTECVIK